MKTKRSFALLMMVSLALGPGLTAKGDNEKARKGNKTIFYQMLWDCDNATGAVYINGFLIKAVDSPQGNGTATLNPWLTGANEIRAEIKKADPSKPSSFALGVSEMVRGEMVSTTDRGTLFSVEKKDSDFAGQKSIAITKNFKSTLDFSKHLLGAGTVDEKRLIEYAGKIYNLFAKKNADALVKEFSVKLGDYEEAFSMVNAAGEFKSSLTGDMFKGKLEKINPAAIKAVRLRADGNLWRMVEGDKELIRMSSSDGSTSEMPIYIGIIDGAPKVIR